MKRHISIFAFLLSAFAAGVQAVPAVTQQGVNVTGYFPPDGGNYVVDTTCVKPPSANLWSSSDPQVFSAELKKGQKVLQWWVKKTYGFVEGEPAGEPYNGEPLSGSAGRANLEWSFDADYGTLVYLAVGYDYITYAVHYDTNGGSSPAGNVSKRYDESVTLASAPTKTGYTFGGWKASSNGIVYQAGASVPGNALCLDTWHDDNQTVTMTAQWTENTYGISASGENCTVTLSKASGVKYTETVTISWSPTEQAGHTRTFTSAKVLAGETELKSFSSGTSGTFTMSDANGGYFGNVTVRVVYEDKTNQYQVNVSSDGNGTVSKSPSQSGYDFGSTVEISAMPNEGYAFASWSDGGAQTHDVTVGAADVTYTATFTNRVYTLTWNANGGSFADGSSVSNVLMMYKSPFGEMPTATQVTKVLDGWHRDKTTYSPVLSGDLYEWRQDMTLYAHWKDEERYSVIVRAEPTEGGTVTGGGMSQFLKGDKVTLTAIPNAGYRFVEWNDGEKTPIREVTVSGNVEYTARFQGFYTVTFDGEGATSGSMTAQQIYRDEETALSSNAFKRTGHAFLGWAETNDLGRVKFFDGTNVLNIAKAGDTNELHAVWSANTYTVGFLPGGATETMEDQEFVYGQPQALRDCTFVRGDPELWSFAGWTNSAAGGPLYTNRETVVNLTAEPNGRVELTAVWNSTIGELSEAMGCDNLKWDPEFGNWMPGETAWTNGGGTVSCALHTGYAYASMQTVNTITSGTLRFWWKSTGGEQVVIWGADRKGQKILEETDGNWRFVELKLDSPEKIVIYHRRGDDEEFCSIANMTWTPEGSHPVPTDADKVTISSAAVSDGKFTLSFEFDEDFDYLLKTNANLLTDSWGVMEVEGKKTDNILTYEPQIIEGQPQMFYRVDTIRKK